jgi:hypothetical protein
VAAGQVRSFEPDDIPQVASLRNRAFHLTAHPSAAALEDYFELVFFRNPWRDLGLPSLVYEDAAGRVTGFIGVIPRPMRYRDDPVRLAVSSQFMVDPEERGLVPVWLLEAFLGGSQDLCFSDAANDRSRRLWEGLGGSVAVVHGLDWVVALRPLRYAASRLGDHPAVRAARGLTRPLVAAADAVLRAWPSGRSRLDPPAGLQTRTLEAADIAELLPAVTGRTALVPVYDEASARWLLDRVAERHGPGAVRGRLVSTADGRAVGWYLYLRSGVVAHVAQLGASPGRWSDVLRLLLVEAREDGLSAVAGRADPAHAHEISALGCAFAQTGPWALVHSRRPDLALAVLAGKAFLSRLEAEWWVNF